MRKLFVLLVLPALFLGACDDGGGGTSPATGEDRTDVLVAAFEESSAAESQTVTVTLESTPESLAAAAEGQLPEDAAQTILDSSLTIATATGQGDEVSLRLALEVPDTEGLEVLLVGGDLYLRADVRTLAAAFGQDTAIIDQFLQSPTAQQAPFLESFVNGEFIHIEGTDELAGNAGATDQLAAQQQQLLQEFTEAIRADAEVTSEGEDDVGEHLVVSIPFQSVYQRFTDLAARLGGGLATPPPPTDVPEGNLEFDVWVADGRVAQMDFDVVRLSEQAEGDVPEGVEELVIRMAFSEDAEEITAPEGALTVTGEEIMALIFGGAFGGGETGGETGGGETGGFDCSQFENLPPEALEGLTPEERAQLEQLCPGVF
ncbi:MAG: hypothetical protein M3174_03035 [Actinomycetota bacterium]|nr:hypothetical protein [Actinomycetota bacterium]